MRPLLHVITIITLIFKDPSRLFLHIITAALLIDKARGPFLQVSTVTILIVKEISGLFLHVIMIIVLNRDKNPTFPFDFEWKLFFLCRSPTQATRGVPRDVPRCPHLQGHFVELCHGQDGLFDHVDVLVLEQHVQVGDELQQQLDVPFAGDIKGSLEMAPKFTKTASKIPTKPASK